MRNPMMSFWLSAANSWASAGRAFWVAEMQRQQAATLKEMTRQAIRLWEAALQPGVGRGPR
ncbi:hypothetical protein [Marinimicrococcus flavescens]|uniref:Phasin family protein n=1 Tax=Marinimicrococcus flavescens TaxID=3031815 RepID=A0AAP3V1H1_9PROT|nr:hypothetical protein [Marinimicrococcus flavescens]